MRRKRNTKTFFVVIMIAVILVLSIGYEAIFSYVMGRIDPVEYVGVSQQRNGNVRNINHPLCGCATIVIQKITFPL